MDYCSSCRRHLNGALVCPGCGAYAPDIDPHAGGDTRVIGDTSEMDGIGDAAGAGQRTAWHPPAIEPALAPVSASLPRAGTGAVDTDVADGPPTRQTGRAARRRQLARWKKNKRRAVVASAVAIVGGGLTIASMDRYSDHRAEAATASDNRTPSVSPEWTPGQGPPTTTAPTAPERTQRPAAPVSEPAQPQSRPSTDSVEPQQPVESRHRSTATAPPQSNDTTPSGTTEVPTTVRPQPETTTPASGDTPPEDTDPATRQPPATSAPGDDSDEDAPRTPPAAEPSSPQLCLLVVCLG
ncbi:SCO2400 family protein [Streptomyces tendae]